MNYSIQAIEEQVSLAMRSFARQRSTVIETPLLSLPGKMAYGNYCSSLALPGAIRALNGIMSAEEIGARLKKPGVGVALGFTGGYVWSSVLGRLQRYLDAGWPDRDIDLRDGQEAKFALDWWARAMSIYRNDGCLTPDARTDASMSILEPPLAQSLAAAALRRGPPKDRASLRKALAMLDAFSFSIHVEARDGTFNHGPYPLGDGRVMVVKEITDLQNRFLPWIGRSRWLSVSKIVVPYVAKSVDFRFDMMGTMYANPQEFTDRIVGYDILAGDALDAIELADLQDIANQTRGIQRDVFREIAGWDDRWKIEHAAVDYASNFVQLFEAAGADDEFIQRHLIQPFQMAGKPHLEQLISGGLPPVWAYLADGNGSLFPALPV
jgi:hypothetical protein